VRSASEADGFVTIAHLLATLLSMVAFTAMVNIVVAGYGRGVVRAALDDGVRAGSRAGPQAVAVCEQRVRGVLDDLLGGSLGDGVLFDGCAVQGGQVVARADVSFRSWVPSVPDWRFEVGATAVAGAAP